MADLRSEPLFQRAKSGQVRDALDCLEGLVVEGLKHGFFDYSIACEIANGGKRQLVIRAGKSHKFTSSRTRAVTRRRPAIPAWTPKMQNVGPNRHRWDPETGGQEHGAARSRP
jgi:hypothetical protein